MQNSHSGFDYDLNEAMLGGNIFERIFHSSRLKFWSSVTDFRGKKVLDIGCNTGILLIPLLERGIDIVGIDISKEDITKAKRNLKEKQLSTSVVRTGDAQSLPFKSNSFEIILLSDVLEHVSNPKKAAFEALRVARKGGVIVVTVPNEWHPVVKYPRVRKILTGRKDVDEHLDMPFSVEKLIKLFPGTQVVKKGYIGFWSEILVIFKKN